MRSFFDFLKYIPNRFQRVTSSGSYVPQIDGLRFIAIFWVIVYHSSSSALKHYMPAGELENAFIKYQPNGIVGVELFFFISGLIISYPFLSGKAPSLKKFYKRRLLRLEPPYILALTLCFLALGVAGFKPEGAVQFETQTMPIWQSYLSSIFYMHGTLYGTAPKLNPPLWSLEIEVIFYLIAPFILGIYLKMNSFKIRMLFGAVAVFVAILAQAILVNIHYPYYYIFPTHLYGFFLGIVVSDWTTRDPDFYRGRSRIYDGAWIFGFCLLLITASLQVFSQSALNYTGILVLRAVAIACLFFGTAWGPVARRCMGAPWMALIGGACYSIYLVHVPVMHVAGSVVFRYIHPTNLAFAWSITLFIMTIVSILAGMIFYIFVERPCMQQDWPSRFFYRLFPKLASV